MFSDFLFSFRKREKKDNGRVLWAMDFPSEKKKKMAFSENEFFSFVIKTLFLKGFRSLSLVFVERKESQYRLFLRRYEGRTTITKASIMREDSRGQLDCPDTVIRLYFACVVQT